MKYWANSQGRTIIEQIIPQQWNRMRYKTEIQVAAELKNEKCKIIDLNLRKSLSDYSKIAWKMLSKDFYRSSTKKIFWKHFYFLKLIFKKYLKYFQTQPLVFCSDFAYNFVVSVYHAAVIAKLSPSSNPSWAESVIISINPPSHPATRHTGKVSESTIEQ